MGVDAAGRPAEFEAAAAGRARRGAPPAPAGAAAVVLSRTPGVCAVPFVGARRRGALAALPLWCCFLV